MKKIDPWNQFDEAWRAMDRSFRSIDWREMEDARHTQTMDNADPFGRKVHTLTASTWKGRRRIARLFLWLAWRVITRGRAVIRL